MKNLIIILISLLLYGCGDISLTPKQAAKDFASELGVEYQQGGMLYFVDAGVNDFNTVEMAEELYPDAILDPTYGFRILKITQDENTVGILTTQNEMGRKRLAFSPAGFDLATIPKDSLKLFWPFDIHNANILLSAMEDYGVVRLYYPPEIIDNQLKIKFVPVTDNRLSLFLNEVIEGRYPEMVISGPITKSQSYIERTNRLTERGIVRYRYMADIAINNLIGIPSYDGTFAMIERGEYFHYLVLV